MSLPLTVASLLVTFSWTLYGYIIHDKMVMVSTPGISYYFSDWPVFSLASWCACVNILPGFFFFFLNVVSLIILYSNYVFFIVSELSWFYIGTGTAQPLHQVPKEEASSLSALFDLNPPLSPSGKTILIVHW